MTTSKIVPNTFQCFNDYVDRAMQHLTDAELRVLLFATRHILGWQDRISSRQARISLTRFEHGYTWKTQDGVDVHYAGCGLGRVAICKATVSLCEFGFLQKIGEATADGQQWELGDDPNWSMLEARTALQDAKNKARTVKGATVLAEKRAGGSSDELGSGGSSDDTTTGSSDDTGGGSSDEHNESHIQSHDQNQERLNTPAPQADADGETNVIPFKGETSVAYSHKQTSALIAAWWDALEAKPGTLNAKKIYQIKAYHGYAAALLDAGLTPEHITAFVKAQIKGFYKDKSLKFAKVADDAPAWVHANPNACVRYVTENGAPIDVIPVELPAVAGGETQHYPDVADMIASLTRQKSGNRS